MNTIILVKDVSQLFILILNLLIKFIKLWKDYKKVNKYGNSIFRNWSWSTSESS
ncbi:hypothetical protein LEQ41_06995 [Streptococcus agalactiae]|nr:hypothetical protein [Streptococcus agalactiae]